MRLVMCGLVTAFAVCVLACGGGGKVTTAPGGGEQKAEPAGPPVKADSKVLTEEYINQEIAADSKYRGRLVEIEATVRKTGRTDDGRPYIGTIYGSNDNFPPSIMYVFPNEREADVASVKPRDTVTIAGVCRGRINDGKPRMLPGLTFHVLIEDCRIKR